MESSDREGEETEPEGEMTQRMELKEAEIVLSRWQTRRDGYSGESFQGLVSSIKRHGVINPLGVFVNENEEFELVYGHRRLQAARKAGRNTITVDVIGNLQQGEVQEQLYRFQEMVLVDNLFHEDLTVIEVARGLKDLIDQQGLTQEQAAKIAGKSQQWVSDKLALLKCAPEVQEAVTERAVEETVAKKLAQLPEDVQGPVLKSVKGQPSRQAAPVIEGIREALEPGFWDLPEDEPWTAIDVNVKTMIDQCLEEVPEDQRPEVLVKLSEAGVLKPPKDQFPSHMGPVTTACGAERQGLSAWLADHGRKCETCVWQEEKLHWQCGQEHRESCEHYLIEDDPIRLPVPYGESDEECQECQEDPGWCTDVACYTLKWKAAEAEQQEGRDEMSLERAIAAQDRLREFYNAQLIDEVDGDHWLAQGCQHCAFWRGPAARDPCDSERAEHIRTAFWRNDGVVVPHCSGYEIKDLKRILEIDQSHFEEIVLGWLDALSSNIGWVPGDDEDEMIQAIREAGLNKKQLVSLMTHAVNPALNSCGKDLHLMDAITGEEAKWTRMTEEDTTPESG